MIQLILEIFYLIIHIVLFYPHILHLFYQQILLMPQCKNFFFYKYNINFVYHHYILKMFLKFLLFFEKKNNILQKIEKMY